MQYYANISVDQTSIHVLTNVQNLSLAVSPKWIHKKRFYDQHLLVIYEANYQPTYQCRV